MWVTPQWYLSTTSWYVRIFNDSVNVFPQYEYMIIGCSPDKNEEIEEYLFR